MPENMPIETALVVGGIILAFVLFGAALFWADYATRHGGPKS